MIAIEMLLVYYAPELKLLRQVLPNVKPVERA